MSTAAITMALGKQADRADLGARLRDGEPGAFESLVSLYQGRIARLAYRLLGWSGDVDDVVQEVFLAALRNAGSFRGEASLWTWLTRITLNRCRTHQRRRLMWQRLRRVLSRHRPGSSEPADGGAVRDEMAGAVRAAVAALPARDREVVVLFYLEQQPAAEIAALLGTSANAVEVRLHRARAKLRIALQKVMADMT